MEKLKSPSTSSLVVASCVIDAPIPKLLDYAIPETLLGTLEEGMHVKVPIRGRVVSAFIFKLKSESEFQNLLPLIEVSSQGAKIPSELFSLAEWMSRYYACSLNQTLRCIIPTQIRKEVSEIYQKHIHLKAHPDDLPKLYQLLKRAPKQVKILSELKKHAQGIPLNELLEITETSHSTVTSLEKKGLITVESISCFRSPLKNATYFPSPKKDLFPEQKIALDRIISSLDKKSFEAHLLHGITGSGKTEVYLQAIEHALNQGKQAIVLVPEISLTEQTIERFKKRFNIEIAVYHHRLSDGEKRDQWFKLAAGEIDLVIGARSALFMPLPRLGLIVIDEEHESSYKSETIPCYHARDVALIRAKKINATVIMGSATPSLESYTNARKGKYQLSTLTERTGKHSLPKITVVDMKKEWERKRYIFSSALLDALFKRYEKGEQSILFLNRRGFHTSLLCKGCGETVSCPHCSTTLTFHKSSKQLSCHLCRYTIAPPKNCPSCKASTVEYKGFGTERVEQMLKALRPEMRVLRIDRDTTARKGSLEKQLKQFQTHKADIMIGTQMIAKGLDFPLVTLVGVLNADGALAIPDFRAQERAFQLITQVAGRAGRASLPGEVIIQTIMPEHSSIRLAKDQAYEPFYEEEIAVRKLFTFPPFSKMVKILFTGSSDQAVQQASEQFYQSLVKKLPATYLLHPPHPAGYHKVKNQFRHQVLLRGNSTLFAIQVIKPLLAKIPRSIRTTIDVDPLSTFF